MITVTVEMLPAGTTGRVRTHSYPDVIEWGYINDGETILISQSESKTYISVYRIDRIIETETNVLKMVK